MDGNNALKPIIIGGIVAVLVIGAFILGQNQAFEPAGPAEKLGETLDKAAKELEEKVGNGG